MLLGQQLDRLAAFKQLRAHMGQPDLFYVAAECLVGMRFENALQLARANLDALCHKLQREGLLELSLINCSAGLHKAKRSARITQRDGCVVLDFFAGHITKACAHAAWHAQKQPHQVHWMAAEIS